MISLKGWSEETLTEAAALLRQATTLDPDFALAHAQLALFLSLGARLGLVADGAAAVTEARTEAERAVAIDHDASEVLGYAGCALAELGDVQRGTELLERSPLVHDEGSVAGLGREVTIPSRWGRSRRSSVSG
jgi:adenylate cyclase